MCHEERNAEKLDGEKNIEHRTTIYIFKRTQITIVIGDVNNNVKLIKRNLASLVATYSLHSYDTVHTF